ncbi:Hypothetical protein D9617_3g020900 [Elsinoe fawcettii]|nr:Hypothetical protein D9617_3g020900 [Elsinoe fawcettii]
MAEYDIFQQIHIQGHTANFLGMSVGPEWLLQFRMNRAVKHMLENKLQPKHDWELVWGPKVFKEESSPLEAGLDNAWFITRCKNAVFSDGTFDTVLISIAGTAVFSSTDWTVQDFGVNNVVNYDNWTGKWNNPPIKDPAMTQNPTTSGPWTAYGTSHGVFNLVTQKDHSGTTILDYLTNNVQGNVRLVVTGHSLGGALSPALAFGLQNSGLLKITNPTTNVRVMPSAGATPGDDAFRTQYKGYFAVKQDGDKSYQVWNADWYNTLDIVPQAWDDETGVPRSLNNILDIYGTIKDPNVIKQIQPWITKAENQAGSSGILYRPIDGQSFTGTAVDVPTSIVDFLIKAAKQHTTEYTKQLGLQDAVGELYDVFFDPVKDEQGDGEVRKVNLFEAAQRFGPLVGVKEEHLPRGLREVYPYDCISQQKEVHVPEGLR